MYPIAWNPKWGLPCIDSVWMAILNDDKPSNVSTDFLYARPGSQNVGRQTCNRIRVALKEGDACQQSWT